MLEYIISPRVAERNPWDMLILGVIVTTLAILFAVILRPYIPMPTSILAIVVIVIALVPLIHRVLVLEERKDEKVGAHTLDMKFFSRHMDVLALYTFLFIGILMAYTFWYVVLPEDMTKVIFDEQVKVYSFLGPKEDAAASGSVYSPGCFRFLYENNLRVMFFCFLASSLFGVGALWILSWNASIIAVVIGEKIRQQLIHLPAMYGYFVGFPLYSMQLALWGIPEYGAYFLAGLSGGILSVAFARHHYRSRGFLFALYDSLILMAMAVSLVLLGAYIEHFFVISGIC